MRHGSSPPRFFARAAAALALVPFGCWAVEPVDFAHDILPVLRTRCAQCHTAGTYKADVSLDSRRAMLDSQVVVPGDAASSVLIERISSPDPEFRMPPKGPALSEDQVQVFRRWVAEGAVWPDEIVLNAAPSRESLALVRPPLPPAQEGRRHAIDRFVDQYWTEHGISRPQPLDDLAFLRRVHVDLVGLLPTIEQQERFLQDTSPHKRQNLIDQLLSDDRAYAEHWLSFWNDLLRNDYAGTGYIDGGRQQITGWLYHSLLANKPYDQLVRELIQPVSGADGFIQGIKWRGRVNASQRPELQFAQNVSQVFLGINMKCASCHDSFIDNWRLVDAYGLAAIVAEAPLEIHRCDKPTGEIAHAQFLFPGLGDVDADASRQERLAQLAQLLTSQENGRFARTIVNRLWHRLMGRGIVQPVDVMSNAPWSPALLDYLALDLMENGYDLKHMLRRIAESSCYQSSCVDQTSETDGEAFVFRGPWARRMTAEQFMDAVWQITGMWPQAADADFPDRGGRPIRASLVNANALMRAMGRPNREQVVTTRPEELTTLEAIDLANGALFARTLSEGAGRMLAENESRSKRDWFVWLYRSALCREPTPSELAVLDEPLDETVDRAQLADLLWMVFMLPEFQLIR